MRIWAGRCIALGAAPQHVISTRQVPPPEWRGTAESPGTLSMPSTIRQRDDLHNNKGPAEFGGGSQARHESGDHDNLRKPRAVPWFRGSVSVRSWLSPKREERFKLPVIINCVSPAHGVPLSVLGRHKCTRFPCWCKVRCTDECSRPPRPPAEKRSPNDIRCRVDIHPGSCRSFAI